MESHLKETSNKKGRSKQNKRKLKEEIMHGTEKNFNPNQKHYLKGTVKSVPTVSRKKHGQSRKWNQKREIYPLLPSSLCVCLCMCVC